jgi:hypothetical protein
VVVVASAATALSLLLWTAAPFTGVSDLGGLDEGTGDSTRYLMPGIAVGVLTIALAASWGRAARIAVVAVLAVAALANLRAAFALGFPALPGPGTLVTGVAAGAATGVGIGALAVAVARRIGDREGSPSGAARAGGWPSAAVRLATGAGAALLAAGSLALGAQSYLARHAETGLFDAGLARWFADQPDFTETEGRTVAMTTSLNGVLTGDRLQHSLALVGSEEPCARVQARLREGWVVVAESGFNRGVARGPGRCLANRPRAYADGAFSVYAGAAAGAESDAGSPRTVHRASTRSSARAASTSRPTSAATRKRAVP